jgi:thymidylate synthase (FAD)
MRIVEQSFELIGRKPSGDVYASIAAAGRVCYKSAPTDEPDYAFVKRLIAKGHESVIEHEGASAIITTDRGVMAELTRHRLASFSVQSTRYVRHDDPESFAVIRPPFKDEASEAAWLHAMTAAEGAYRRLIQAGERPQIARAVLPQCLATTIRMTANFREWRHILRLRTSPAAHPQMRELMTLARGKLGSFYPDMFEDLKWRRADD